ncbi:glycosyltransferase [Desulfobaculum sp. SPO524]|uniref:glycosyltransferase family protein n=1 Tax=Desulfobaculum sp. SPO524 TaxID=3378071 RepID=UPI003852162C
MHTSTIAWMGNPFFSAALSRLGYAVVRVPMPQGRLLTFDEVCAACGGVPDAAVYGDISQSPPLDSVENWPCLTAFHCVDAHIHSWYPAYAQCFDLCSVALRDVIPAFLEGAFTPQQVLWLPNFAFDDIQPRAAHKEWDVAFIGTVSARTTPRRKRFLDRLAMHIPGLVAQRGDFRALYPKAKLVLNYCEGGDLNFRVFEALATGSCLLTPRIGHGQDDLFTDGEHLLLYDMGDVRGLVERINDALADKQRREAIGARGLHAVNAAHRASHRAQAFASWLFSFPAQTLVAERRLYAPALKNMLKLLYLHFAETTQPSRLREEYLRMGTHRGG